MNCLITKKGKIIKCLDGSHEDQCKLSTGDSLYTFLFKKSGVRVKPNFLINDSIAFEFCHKPTEQQTAVINEILRNNNYYAVVTNFDVIEKSRPIRSL